MQLPSRTAHLLVRLVATALALGASGCMRLVDTDPRDGAVAAADVASDAATKTEVGPRADGPPRDAPPRADVWPDSSDLRDLPLDVLGSKDAILLKDKLAMKIEFGPKPDLRPRDLPPPVDQTPLADLPSAITSVLIVSKTASADCPLGSQLVGGGGQCLQNGRLKESYPTSNSQWAVTCVTSGNTSSAPVASYARCVTTSMPLVHVSASTLGTAVGEVLVHCPSGTWEIGGGCECAGTTTLVSSTASKSLKSGVDPAWRCFCSGVGAHVAHAICLDKARFASLGIERRLVQIGSGTFVDKICQTGQTPLGGGCLQTLANPGGVISSRPTTLGWACLYETPASHLVDFFCANEL